MMPGNPARGAQGLRGAQGGPPPDRDGELDFSSPEQSGLIVLLEDI